MGAGGGSSPRTTEGLEKEILAEPRNANKRWTLGVGLAPPAPTEEGTPPDGETVGW